MPIVDDRTPNLDLALPNANNIQTDDVPRLRETLTALDAIIHGVQIALAGKATAEEITVAVSSVVNSAPETLNQLNELAAAINNDPNFAATILSQLANKLPNVAATPTVLGGVKVGSGLVADPDGTISVVPGDGGTGLPAYTDLYLTPASNGQTVFTVSGGYTPGLIDVVLNGVLLYGGGDDYTASNGTSLTLAVGANTTDKLMVRRWAYIPASMAFSKAGDTMTGAINEAPPVTAASAGVLNIGVLASNNITITGTTAITSFGTFDAGAVRRVTFSGVLVLTHNATSMILPGAANITTIAGDVAEFVSLGSGNWRCASYLRSNGQALALVGKAGATGTEVPQAQEVLMKNGGTMTGPLVTKATRETKTAMAANDIDMSAGNVFTKTITSATTFTVSNVPAAGVSQSIILKLTNPGAGVLTWFSGIKWPGGTVPTWTVSGRDNVYLQTDDGGTTWDAMVAKDVK